MGNKNPARTTDNSARRKSAGYQLLLQVLYVLSVIVFASSPLMAKGSETVLILNSNLSVKKYSQMQTAFKTHFEGATVEIDVGSNWFDEKVVEKSIRDTKPGLIFCIGSKSYVLACKMAGNAKIIFSLGINWQRFPLTDKTYVIANELAPVMELTTCRYILPSVGKVGVIYSKTHNKEWFQTALAEAAEVGLEVIGIPIENDTEVKEALKGLLPAVDALWLISDPVVLAGTERVKEIFSLCDSLKKPVLAYDKLFANFGATLIISADIATMGKQAAKMANNILYNKESMVKAQNPAGSHIAINVKKLEQYGIPLNPKALSSINEFIEQ